MPTVYREGGFRFFMWPNDHRPPHVHVEYGGGDAVIEIGSLDVRDVHELRFPDVRRAIAIVQANRETLLNHWSRIHAKHPAN
jgi:hypothetical protein